MLTTDVRSELKTQLVINGEKHSLRSRSYIIASKTFRSLSQRFLY
jgi:hypothetical protein